MIQYEAIVNLIQMKLMKVTDDLRNTMIQEVQHFVIFHLIEVMKMTMQVIRFELTEKVIQTILPQT
jgi:hypothetical protein